MAPYIFPMGSRLGLGGSILIEFWFVKFQSTHDIIQLSDQSWGSREYVMYGHYTLWMLV